MPEAPPLKEPLWWNYSTGRIEVPYQPAKARPAYEPLPSGFYYSPGWLAAKKVRSKAEYMRLGGLWPWKKGWRHRLAKAINERIQQGEPQRVEEFQRLLFRDD